MTGRTLIPDASIAPAEQETAAEFEFVMGPRQAASLAFLGLVLLATVAGGAYLIGKAAAAPSAAPVAAPPPVVQTPPAAPQPEASAAPEPTPAPKPLYDKPLKGVVYIQMGAVEKGIAEIFAEGLRHRGFDSFVAPGPNDRIFRVLIGPFKNGDQYDATKQSLDAMGLNTFGRRYEE